MVRLLVLALTSVSIPMAAGADPIVTGDIVRFSDLAGSTGGGEFLVTDVNNPSEWIITFCLQKTEFMNFSSNFVVGSINPYTLTDPDNKGGVNGKDPISSQTAWLYTQFTNHTLASYDYANSGNGTFSSREASANALQHAFWGFENEEELDLSNYYVQLAINSTPANFGTGDVAVLNLYSLSGGEAQDQLTRSVPEPSTMALMGVGLCGLFMRRRQKA
jgi:hypothetical protein